MASKTPTYGKDLPGNLGTDGVLRAIYDKIGDSSSGNRIEEKLNTIISLTEDVNNNILINTEAVKLNTLAINDISINVDIQSEDIKLIASAIDKLTEAIKENTLAIKDISINVDFPTKAIKSITTAINKLTKVIKDISINSTIDVKIDTKEVCNYIDRVNDSIYTLDENITNGFNRTINTIKESNPQPQPYPIHPCCPKPEPDVIFYPAPPYPIHPCCPKPEPDVIFYPAPLGFPKPIHYQQNYNNINRCTNYKCRQTEKKKEKKPECKTFVPEDLRPSYRTLNPDCNPDSIAYYKELREKKLGYKGGFSCGKLRATLIK